MNCKVQFPLSFVNLIDELGECFTKPSLKLFKVIIMGILINPSRKTLTATIRLCGFNNNFSNLHRFMGRYKWNIQSLCLGLLFLVLVKLTPKGTLVFALDDTLVPKYGKEIFGRSKHLDHAAKTNRPRYIMGLNWVVIALLYHSSIFSKWLSFPLLARLFVAEDKMPKDDPFRSRIEIAIEMLESFKDKLKERFIIIADALYAKRNLIRFCIKEGITLISRLRVDAALYKSPPKVKGKKRGRPRKYGEKLASLSSLSQKEKGYHVYRVNLYGKEQEIQVKTFNAIWKPAGDKVKVLIVKFYKAKGPSFFFSTDITLSVEKILELVSARWSIETAFLNMKQYMGFEDWQVRQRQSVERSATITCASLTLLTLWSLLEASRREPELWDILPWYPQKRSVSILDMRKQLKTKVIKKTIFHVLGKDPLSEGKIEELSGFFSLAA